MEINDYLIIGAGCCGAMAAKTLAEAGQKVLLLDGGMVPKKQYKSNQTDYAGIRQDDPHQLSFLLGDDFESIKSIQNDHSVHLTPNRQFTIAQVQDYLNWQKGDFTPIESLAKGGLGNAWGLGSFVYSEQELVNTGLPLAEMKRAYQWVSKVVGISGGDDDACDYANGHLFKPQKAIPLDFNGERLMKAYQKHKKDLRKKGFYIGRTPLAVGTENDINGEVFRANDLDFYDVRKGSAFRPINLIEKLEAEGAIVYKPYQFVMSFHQGDEYTSIATIDMRTQEKNTFYCKKLILAAGALGSGRIVMRSLNKEKTPLICNPYSYIPSLQFPLIGAVNKGYQTGLGQISLFYDPHGQHKEVAMGTTYSYRALMGFRLMLEFPFDYKSNIQWLKLLQPALNITGLFHPEYGSTQKFMQRFPDQNSLSGDTVKGTYQLSAEEHNSISQTEKAFKKALRQMGTIPLKVHRNKHGASIHYGGTLPFNAKNHEAGTQPNGRLNGYSNIFVADGSGFQFLSGKGLTLTLMAYAHLVAKHALQS
jgi:hypothetical protein